MTISPRNVKAMKKGSCGGPPEYNLKQSSVTFMCQCRQ